MPEMSGFVFAGEIRKMESLKGIPIILLTSVGEIGHVKKCREIGIQGYLTKPTRKDYMLKAIESVLHITGKEDEQISLPTVTRHTIAERYSKDEIQILLAEDYPTNQQIAMRHLKKAGYRVDLAENGQQAVDAYKKKHYDIIFMDIQMPEMDGYEATAKIRAREGEPENRNSQSATRAVIIAMTAHATTKDQKKCLDSGMDDYISKPLRRTELLALVDKWANKIAEPG
jgi:CheY-like chemotaxis protein